MATQAIWSDVEAYFEQALIVPDAHLDAALARATAAGLPPHQVSASQGKFLAFLVQIQGARRVLELGTLAAYSTIWLARALPDDGRVVTVEYDPHHAEIAHQNLTDAGVLAKVELRVGAALDVLPQIAADNPVPFDFIFIDADKRNNVAYVEWALKLGRVGTVIVVDNVVRNGAILATDGADESTRGVQALVEFLADEKRLDGVALQVVGSKGYDGFILLRIGD